MSVVVYNFPRGSNRERWIQPIITIHFDETECRFLLWRLRNVNAMVEALTHRIDPMLHKQPWERHQVVRRVWDAIHTIERSHCIHIFGGLMTAIITQAIEGNTYFWNLPPDDPRKCARNIQKADACRLKIQQAIKRPVRRFKV